MASDDADYQYIINAGSYWAIHLIGMAQFKLRR